MQLYPNQRKPYGPTCRLCLSLLHFSIYSLWYWTSTLLPILAKERKSPFFTNLCVKKNIFISFSMKLNCKVLRCFPFSVICWWVNFKQLLPYSFLSNPVSSNSFLMISLFSSCLGIMKPKHDKNWLKEHNFCYNLFKKSIPEEFPNPSPYNWRHASILYACSKFLRYSLKAVLISEQLTLYSSKVETVDQFPHSSF